MHNPDKKANYRRELTTIDWVHDFDIDVEKRDIFLFGREEYARSTDAEEPGVEWTMANRFIRNIRILQALDDAPILVHMKTCGGEWHEGMAIYQAIASCPVPVVVLNYAQARSMSSIILQAADRRAMLPYTTFMFHDGSFGMDGTVKQAFTEVEQLKISCGQMIDIYCDSMKRCDRWGAKTENQARAWLRSRMDKKEEVYLNPHETVENGFADLIFGADGHYDWAKLRAF